jgi:hypothetical protein
MATRWVFESSRGSDLPESETWDSPNVSALAEQIFKAQAEAGEIYPADTIWLVLDGQGSLIGEVQAWSGVVATLEACRQWPPERGEQRTVILRDDFQAERN